MNSTPENKSISTQTNKDSINEKKLIIISKFQINELLYDNIYAEIYNNIKLELEQNIKIYEDIYVEIYNNIKLELEQNIKTGLKNEKDIKEKMRYREYLNW